ncbi:MAG: hypothetical protein E6Q24_07795 [Chitinophagaceae bacterium]|nr:MAG: hypothetical protein E6Q24_07795 [Chitinophagaceae bacterium]
MDDILMKSVIEKVEAQENKIGEIEAAIKNIPDNTVGIADVKNAVKSIKEIAESISFQIQEMRELSKAIIEVRDRLNRPVTSTVQHHHYIPKIIWLCIVLFVSLAVVCTGWYMTANTLTEYKANDTKYRYLKLNSNKSLLDLLYRTDSLFRTDAGLRDSVIQQEEENQRIFEMLQKANSMEREAEELKRKATGR